MTIILVSDGVNNKLGKSLIATNIEANVIDDRHDEKDGTRHKCQYNKGKSIFFWIIKMT